jgi:hypothetical protein
VHARTNGDCFDPMLVPNDTISDISGSSGRPPGAFRGPAGTAMVVGYANEANRYGRGRRSAVSSSSVFGHNLVQFSECVL